MWREGGGGGEEAWVARRGRKLVWREGGGGGEGSLGGKAGEEACVARRGGGGKEAWVARRGRKLGWQKGERGGGGERSLGGKKKKKGGGGGRLGSIPSSFMLTSADLDTEGTVCARHARGACVCFVPYLSKGHTLQ